MMCWKVRGTWNQMIDRGSLRSMVGTGPGRRIRIKGGERGFKVRLVRLKFK